METSTVMELVHGTVGVDRRGFAEQNHRDGAKRNRDDRLSKAESVKKNLFGEICVKF